MKSIGASQEQLSHICAIIFIISILYKGEIKAQYPEQEYGWGGISVSRYFSDFFQFVFQFQAFVILCMKSIFDQI